jgi:uncharacterized protein
VKGKLHARNDVVLNPSNNDSIRTVIERVDRSRRQFIQASLSASVFAALSGISINGLVKTASASPVPPGSGFAGIGFESIPPYRAVLDAATGQILSPLSDQVSVPPGYNVELLAAWGDPIMSDAPGWAPNASQGASAQELQFGMHNDGMHFFPLMERGQPSSNHGILCVNHEYSHESVLHIDGLDELSGGLSGSLVTIEKVRKSQAAHGVSVLEIRRAGNSSWKVVKDSAYARRITANTPVRLSGPAAGHSLLRTAKYNIHPSASIPLGVTTDGTEGWGTLNNCAHGFTPWGTYLTCEENWNQYFGWKSSAHSQSKLERRYGITRDGATITVPPNPATSTYKWHVVDDRFDAHLTPNEPNTFGWRVEIDPTDPSSVPVKRTAMGRFKAESATLATDPNRRFGFYMGDDERNEYIYKFVCSRPWDPADPAANKDLLDDGILYVARFTSEPGTSSGTYRGLWLPLLPDTETVFSDGAGGKLKLRQLADFSGGNETEIIGNILVKTRMAADAVGATMMDRPEWTAVRPRIGGFSQLEVYCTLTNNNRRGNLPASINNPDGSTAAGSARPPVDVANPRPDNDYGHIIRWREDGGTVTAAGFDWEFFVFCGDTAAATHVPSAKTLAAPGSYNATGHDGYIGNINDAPDGSADFGAPDGIWFDHFGRLWIQTDQMGDGSGDWQKVGSNTMLCADPNTREIRRFLTSPPRCEVTGVITTPDGKSMFVGIQHPGEESRAANPTEFSEWPKSQFGGPGGRPRSAVLAITRIDGGVIGT